MKISKSDIGRSVVLRNGDRARIARWKDGARKPVVVQDSLGKQYYCWVNGRTLCSAENNEDVVGFM